MNPAIGDMVHFRSICAACNKVGRQHFAFAIDDPDLLAILPSFSRRLSVYEDGGRKVNFWWDHSPSILDLYKAKIVAFFETLRALFMHRETHGSRDTHLIVFGGDAHVFLVGPAKNIVPLADREVQNPKIALVANRMKLNQFNYIDLTQYQTESDGG